MWAQFRTDQEFWNMPQLRKTFEDSYLVNSKTEPELSQEERELVRGVLEALAENNDKAAALRQIQNAITSESSAALDFIAASLNAEQGNLKTAISYYETAVEKFPSFLRAYKNGGIMKVQEGRYEAALKDLTRAVELGAVDTMTMGLLGLCYVNTSRYYSAETAYQEAIMMDPSILDWQVGLARALLQQQKYDEAIAVIDQILLEEPENEVYWSSQANAYLGKDDPETAVAIQEIVDRLGKATPESLIFMGNIYLSRGLSELALTYFERALKMDPDQEAEVYVEIAEIMTARGAYQEASSVIGDIRDRLSGSLTDEDKLRILRLQAQIALATDQGERVIPILQELIERDPLDGQALMLLADFYSAKEDVDGYARADLYFDRATKVPEWEVRALISWARSYVSRESFRKAIPLLERAQVLNPQEHIGRYLEQVRKVALAQAGG